MAKSSNKTRAPRPQRQSPDAPRPAGDRTRAWAWGTAAVLALVIMIVYGRSLDAPFIYDDFNSVETNETIRSWWPLVGDAENRGPLYTPQFAPTSARPVANLSLALTYQISGLDPRGHRAFNILLHFLCGVLISAIVRRTLRLPYFDGRFESAADWLALATALLWTLHPLQTEAVVYITQRTELMAAFFYLATFYCSLRYWLAAPADEDKSASAKMSHRDLLRRIAENDRAGWLVLAAIACVLGMGSKQVMASAPLIVLLFERTFIAGSLMKALRGSWPLYIGLALGWLLLLFLNYDNPHRDSIGFHMGVPAHVWWLTQTKVFLMYLKLVIWPWPLLIHYDIPYLETLGDAWFYVIVVAVLGFGTLFLLWKNNPVGFLGTFVFAILSPTFIIPVVTEVAAERRMYLPLVAIAALVVVGGYAFLQDILRRQSQGESRHQPRSSLAAVIALALGVALVLALVSGRRLLAYENELTLWQDVLRLQPHSYVAHQNAGVEYYNMGDLVAAARHCRESVRLKPDSSSGHYSLALVLSKLGQREEASEHFRLAAKYNPDSPELLNNYGVSQFVLGRNDESISTFKQVIRLKPLMWKAHENLGKSLVQAGRLAEAIASFKQAIELNPQALGSYGHLAASQARTGQPADAIATAESALKVARRTGADAMAARIATDLATYRAILANAAASGAGPSATNATPSN
jgi:Flp pilus assembly protein TadD